MSTAPPPSKPPHESGHLDKPGVELGQTGNPTGTIDAAPHITTADLPLSALASASNLPALRIHAADAPSPTAAVGASEPTGQPSAPASPHAAAQPGPAPGSPAKGHGDGHGHGHGHGHSDGHGPAHGHLSPRQRLFSLLSLEASDIWIVSIYAVVIGLLSLATPIAVQSLINQVSFGVLLQPVVLLTLMLFVGLVVVGVLRMLETSVVELLQARLFVRMGADLAARLTHRSYHALDDHDGRELITRMFDITTVQKSMAGLLLDGLAVVLQVLIGLCILAFYHPLLLAFAGALLVCAVFVMFALGRGAVSSAIRESRAKYAVADWLVQVMFQPLAFKAGHGPTLAQERADLLLRGYVQARRDHFRILLRQIGGLLFIQALASAALLGIGGALVIGRQLTIGQLVASEIIVSGVVAALAKFGKYLESLYDLLASLDKLGHLLDIELEPLDNPVQLPPRSSQSSEPGMRVELHQVSLGYPGQAPILRNLNLSITPGQSIAVIGPAGTGKSLLCEALYGLVPVESGLVELDGLSVRDLYLPSLRQHVVLLRGDASEIFTGTLEENILCGRSDASPSELRSALLAVGLWHELQSDPQGLRRPLQSGGSVLSQRQRQCLLAARALLLRPRLLLIDGPALTHVEREPAWLSGLLRGPNRPTVVICVAPGSPLIEACQSAYTLVDQQLVAYLPAAAPANQGGADASPRV